MDYIRANCNNSPLEVRDATQKKPSLRRHLILNLRGFRDATHTLRATRRCQLVRREHAQMAYEATASKVLAGLPGVHHRGSRESLKKKHVYIYIYTKNKKAISSPPPFRASQAPEFIGPDLRGGGALWVARKRLAGTRFMLPVRVFLYHVPPPPSPAQPTPPHPAPPFWGQGMGTFADS